MYLIFIQLTAGERRGWGKALADASVKNASFFYYSLTNKATFHNDYYQFNLQIHNVK